MLSCPISAIQGQHLSNHVFASLMSHNPVEDYPANRSIIEVLKPKEKYCQGKGKWLYWNPSIRKKRSEDLKNSTKLMDIPTLWLTLSFSWFRFKLPEFWYENYLIYSERARAIRSKNWAHFWIPGKMLSIFDTPHDRSRMPIWVAKKSPPGGAGHPPHFGQWSEEGWGVCCGDDKTCHLIIYILLTIQQLNVDKNTT